MKQTIKVADKPTADEIKATAESNASKLDGITTYLESGGGILGNPEYGLEAIKGYLAELKNLVGNGKTNVANAITGKGVPTATDATFATLVKNIESIVTLMQGTQDANAAAPQILRGYSAYVKGEKVNGSMNSLGAQTITPGTANKTIAANQYLSGVQTIAGDPNLVAANIAKGKSIFGVAGSFKGDNAKSGDLIVQSGSGITNLASNKTYNIGFKPSFLICYIFATYLSAAILCLKGSTWFRYGLINGSTTGASSVYEQIEITDNGFKVLTYGTSFRATGSGSDFIAAKYIALP